MEINSQLNKLKDFLEDKVCSKVKLKAETKTREYELVNPKCFVFAPREMRLENINYPFISIEFDEIIDNRQTELYSIQLYVFVFDNGVNVLNNNGARSYYPTKGQGYVTLFNLISKIRRELILDRSIGKLIKSDITIKMIDGIEPPYYSAVIIFKLEGLPYPQPADKDIKGFLDL